MSFPIFFQRYVDGNLVNFDRSTIVRILGSGAVMDGGDISAIQFSNSDGGEVYGADADSFEQLSFEGEGDRFFDALWRIADATDAFIYWLGDGNCSAVAKSATIAELPTDIVQDTGPVKVVKTGAELEAALDPDA